MKEEVSSIVAAVRWKVRGLMIAVGQQHLRNTEIVDMLDDILEDLQLVERLTERG